MVDAAGTTWVYIALGSNIGDREAWLMRALEELGKKSGVRRIRRSSIYETEPVGYTEQPAFLNMAAAVEIEIPVRTLFEHMRDIELKLGRTREIHWGPRTIDLDLLIAERLDHRIAEPDLIVPHPRMTERAFVLVPLLDVLEPQHPDRDRLAHILQSLPDQEGVKEWRLIRSQDASGRSAN